MLSHTAPWTTALVQGASKEFMIKLKRQVEKMIKKIDKLKSPNVYAFLIERGVSDEIADDAQQFCCEHYNDVLYDFQAGVVKSITDDVESIEDELDGFREAVIGFNEFLLHKYV